MFVGHVDGERTVDQIAKEEHGVCCLWPLQPSICWSLQCREVVWLWRTSRRKVSHLFVGAPTKDVPLATISLRLAYRETPVYAHAAVPAFPAGRSDRRVLGAA